MKTQSNKPLSYSLLMMVLWVGVQMMTYLIPIFSAIYIAFQSQYWQLLSALASFNHYAYY